MPKLVNADPSGPSQVISLDDLQMAQLRDAASLLPVEARDNFLRSVANRVNGCCDPSDADIHEAIEFVISARRISYRTHFCLNDSSTTPRSDWRPYRQSRRFRVSRR
jgi:hypothetical protein